MCHTSSWESPHALSPPTSTGVTPYMYELPARTYEPNVIAESHGNLRSQATELSGHIFLRHRLKGSSGSQSCCSISTSKGPAVSKAGLVQAWSTWQYHAIPMPSYAYNQNMTHASFTNHQRTRQHPFNPNASFDFVPRKCFPIQNSSGIEVSSSIVC